MADAHLNGSLNLPPLFRKLRDQGVIAPATRFTTECGTGRKPREFVPELLEIQARVHV